MDASCNINQQDSAVYERVTNALVDQPKNQEMKGGKRMEEKKVTLAGVTAKSKWVKKILWVGRIYVSSLIGTIGKLTKVHKLQWRPHIGKTYFFHWKYQYCFFKDSLRYLSLLIKV